MEKEEKPDNYVSREAEPRIRAFWEKQKIYAFDAKRKGKIFSVDTPPPTVSGQMHVGHAYSYTQQDTIIRFKRMNGFNVFYPFGTDDNGLPTERLIEKMKGVKAKDMQKGEFIKLCLSTLKESLPEFVEDWKRIGISCDFNIYYSTMNEHSRRISQRSFIELYEKGREYQKEAPTIWCPECQTAIAQFELQDKESDTMFNDIVFKSGKDDLIIATTRPELLSSCVCLFYNPSDQRYKKFKGKKAKVPLFNFEVPILEDEKADPSKGTGIVMCCTFGDQQDVDWFKQHNLPLKISIDEKGHMNEKAIKYQGLYVKKARKQIIEDLKAVGLLIKQTPIKHSVNVHERCGTDIEFLVTKQWFIKYLDLKDKFLEQSEKLKWHPEFMKVRLDNWIKGLKWDWCISRQRYFGVPFPVWYCAKCGWVILADKKKLPVDPLTDKPPVNKCPGCQGIEFVPEKDVLDTWATSSLTPQLAIELMPKSVQKKLYPMSLRPQAHDIISFWLFNTIVKGYLHYDKLPWGHTMISGFVLDPYGEKMAKSTGNVVEPSEIIKKYSADTLRFAACASKLGEDAPFQEKELVAGQKLVNKLWNASKFVSMHLQEKIKQPKNLDGFDKWIILKMNRLIENSTESFENYEYSRVKSEFENFFWHTFCDNYLEIVKDRLYSTERSKEEKESAKFTLYNSLLKNVKILAPIMPFITEELYQKYFKQNEKMESIHVSKWPEVLKIKDLKKVEEAGDIAIGIMQQVRQFKSRNGKSLKAPIILTIEKGHEKVLKEFLKDLKAVCSANEIKFGKFEIKFVE
ncbi:MAG: valine--tRNA ligase [Nanoarchaeota archaeon]|nr:valine--tRNA ligase [Nanoarchaeota archaeon]